jgi:hypothetical protein
MPSDLPALWAALGYANRAEFLIGYVPYDKASAVAKLAGAVAGRGNVDRAMALTWSIQFQPGQERDPYEKARAWAELAWMVARSGDRSMAGVLARRAESLIDSLTTMPYLQALILMDLARVASACGKDDKANALSDEAESLARSTINEPSWDKWVMDVLPVVATGAGDLDRAENLVRSIDGPYHQARAMAALAVVVAAQGDHDRAEEVVRTITDHHRRERTAMAMAAMRAIRGERTGASSRSDPYWWARTQRAFARMVAAGGKGHAWGMSDWAEPLARYGTDPDDQVRMFDALAAAVVGGDRRRAAALAVRAEALARFEPDPEDRPQVLTSLAWMVAGAGDHNRAATLAAAADALAKNPFGLSQQTWTVAGLAATVLDTLDRDEERALPAMTGSARRRAWAGVLRYQFVTDRWITEIPPSVRERLLRLTDAQWWIDNRDRLDEAIAAQTGLSDEELLPELMGTPKQLDWARRVRAGHIRNRWAARIPPEARAVLIELTNAGWWLDNRDDLDTALADEIEARRPPPNPWGL